MDVIVKWGIAETGQIRLADLTGRKNGWNEERTNRGRMEEGEEAEEQ